MSNFPILFIHCRRGLYQLTICQKCQFQFQCENCDCNLTTYRTFEKQMTLLCHQCQSQYTYPKICPSCSSDDLKSVFGGIEDLAETLQKEYNQKVIRLDLQQAFDPIQKIFVSTRIFDPSIDYTNFGTIIFIQADNILSSTEYLANEDIHQNLTHLFLNVDEKTKIIFDTQNPENPFFVALTQLNKSHQDKIDLINWFYDFLTIETKNRLKYDLPPFQNIILLTSQNKNKQKSFDNTKMAKQYLQTYINQEKLSGIKISSVYPAKFLKRKGYFANHFLVKYPKQFPDYFALKNIVKNTSNTYGLQVRLNPKHIF
jgi:primosomal protein N' (replication factor Y) (superfamily II helicase)